MKKPLSYNTLPEGYKTVYEINLLSNKKLAITINALSVVMLLPFIIVLPFLKIKLFSIELGLLSLVKFGVFFVGYLFAIMLHELTHGICFRIASKKKVKYNFHILYFSASVPDSYFVKNYYLVIGLAPSVVVNLILIIMTTLFYFYLPNWFIIIYFIFAFHFVGCVGDFYVCGKLLKMKSDTLVQDVGVGMTMFQKAEQENKLEQENTQNQEI